MAAVAPLARLVLSLLVLAAAVAPRPATGGTDPAAAIDAYVHAAQDVQHFQGTVLVARDGVPLLEKGYGLASRELGVPNTPATKHLIGSLTKQFTAAAILQLQERGLLSVQDPIAKHLPAWPRATAERVTIHQLLSHTAGIPSYTDDAVLMARRTVEITLDELCATFQDKPLDFEPGTSWSYSNSGYVILGRIIEAVSGETYEQYLRAHILDPAGMSDTGYSHLETIIPNRASGHVWRDGGWANAPRVAMSMPYAAGALHTTAADLLRWDQALYGETILSARSKEQMFTPVRQDYGYGQIIVERFGHREIMHAGGIDGFSAYLARYPDDRLTIIVLGNNESVPAYNIGMNIAAILFEQPYDLPATRTPVAIDPAVFARCVGDYELAPDFVISVRARDGRFFTQATGQPELEIFAISESEFYLQDVEARLSFQGDATGAVTGLILHQVGREMPARKIR
jgi:CubicO group peptidase (beta-lactamase class C family)